MNALIARFVLFTLALSVVGCYREPKQKGTFTLTGTLVDACTGEPVAGQYFQLKLVVNPDYSPRRSYFNDLGHGFTDAAGRFRFECAYYKTSNQKRYLLETRERSGAGEGMIIAVDDEREVSQVVPLYRTGGWMNFYLTSSRPLSASDTLFIGIPGIYSLHPISTGEVHTIHWPRGITDDPGDNSHSSRGEQVWGIGRVEYDRASSLYSGLRQRWPMTVFSCPNSHVDTVHIQ